MKNAIEQQQSILFRYVKRLEKLREHINEMHEIEKQWVQEILVMEKHLRDMKRRAGGAQA